MSGVSAPLIFRNRVCDQTNRVPYIWAENLKTPIFRFLVYNSKQLNMIHNSYV